jgi:restriction system protein
MAEITKKRTGELQRGAFKILSDQPDGLPAREVLERLEKSVPPTPFEKSYYPKHPGVRRFEKIVRFSTIGCVKVGWLEKSKGRWTLTDRGRQAFQQIVDPEKFCREIDRLYKEWADTNQTTELEQESSDLESPRTSVSFEKADEEAWSEIQSYIEKIDPYNFQNKLVPGLLKGMGYHIAWAAPPGADGGIDIIAYPDPLGMREPTIKVSVRRRVDQKADVKDIREFLSRLHNNEVGIFISVSGFTRDAARECRQEQRKIRLLDLETFFDLWVEHYAKIPEAERKFLPIKPVWFLAMSDSE